MAAAFVREGDDACSLCADPAFSYFLVSGSLEVTSVNAAPSPLASAPLFGSSTAYSSHRAPSGEVPAVAESKVGEVSTRAGSPKGREKTETFPRPVACGIEKPAGLTFWSWTYPHDNTSISGSALTPVQGNGGETMGDGSDVGSAGSKTRFSAPVMPCAEAGTSPSAPKANTAPSTENEQRMEQAEGCPLLPGQSLDSYLLHKSARAAEETGPEDNHHKAGHPEDDVSAFPEGLVCDEGPPRRWRLEAQERVCVGRVSHRFLQELEREEPKHDVEVKVAFLRRTEASQETLRIVGLRRSENSKQSIKEPLSPEDL